MPRNPPAEQPCPLCHATASLHATTAWGSYFRCRECDLVSQWREELPDASSERAHYATHQNDSSDAGYRGFLGRLATPLFDMLAPGAEGIDYGAGPGPTLSVMAAEAGFSMVDYDPFFAPDPQLLERQYDFITCTEAVEHFHHPDREFSQLAQLLRPGGLLGVMTELHDTGGEFCDWWYHRDPTHVIFLSRSTLDWLANRHHWTIRRQERAVTIFQSHS